MVHANQLTGKKAIDEIRKNNRKENAIVEFRIIWFCSGHWKHRNSGKKDLKRKLHENARASGLIVWPHLRASCNGVETNVRVQALLTKIEKDRKWLNRLIYWSHGPIQPHIPCANENKHNVENENGLPEKKNWHYETLAFLKLTICKYMWMNCIYITILCSNTSTFLCRCTLLI